jgi:outer membrane lipoprotein
MRVPLFLAVLMLCLPGCTTIISKESLNLVDRKISFAELRQDPQRYVGKVLLLGGGIVGVRNTNDGSELEIVQFPTDESGEITDTVASGGRFIAWSSGFLDPSLYRTGLLVALVGEVRGKKTMQLGEVEYTYPVLAIREVHLMKPEEGRSPTFFHFGFGVGTIIR